MGTTWDALLKHDAEAREGDTESARIFAAIVFLCGQIDELREENTLLKRAIGLAE